MTLGSVYFDTRVLFGILMIILVFGSLIVFLQLKKSKINRKIKRCSEEIVGIVEAVSESKIENKIIKHNKEYIETESYCVPIVRYSYNDKNYKEEGAYNYIKHKEKKKIKSFIGKEIKMFMNPKKPEDFILETDGFEKDVKLYSAYQICFTIICVGFSIMLFFLGFSN